MSAKGRSVEGGMYGAYGGCDGLSSVLTREQDRALRAKAWRHVRRINPAVARRVWRNHRVIRQFLPYITGTRPHPDETDREYINRVHAS